MKHFTRESYKAKGGVKMAERSMTQLSGYVPTEKRVTDLLMAGLIRQSAADEYYDSQFEYDADLSDVPPIPPLPRAFAVDLADVSQLALQYKERSRVINERIQAAAVAGKLRKSPSSVEQVPHDKRSAGVTPEAVSKPPVVSQPEGV